MNATKLPRISGINAPRFAGERKEIHALDRTREAIRERATGDTERSIKAGFKRTVVRGANGEQ